MKTMRLLMAFFVATTLLWAAPPEGDQETDWEARITKKQAEVEELLGILGPVVEFVTAALAEGRTNEIIEEDWADAGKHLGEANEMYEECKARMEKKEATKALFLRLENVWQIYVKAGVSGVRTKSMIDSLPQ